MQHHLPQQQQQLLHRMAHTALAESAAALEAALSGLRTHVDRVRDQCSHVLAAGKEQEDSRPLHKGTLTDDAPNVNPLRYASGLPDTRQPFAFQAPDRPIGFRRLRSVDPQQLLASNDTATAMSLLDEVAMGDFQGGSIYERSEANLLKLLQLAQLQLQYLRYQLADKVQAEQGIEDDTLALAAGLRSLGAPSLTDVEQRLGSLGDSIRQLGGPRMAGALMMAAANKSEDSGSSGNVGSKARLQRCRGRPAVGDAGAGGGAKAAAAGVDDGVGSAADS